LAVSGQPGSGIIENFLHAAQDLYGVNVAVNVNVNRYAAFHGAVKPKQPGRTNPFERVDVAVFVPRVRLPFAHDFDKLLMSVRGAILGQGGDEFAHIIFFSFDVIFDESAVSGRVEQQLIEEFERPLEYRRFRGQVAFVGYRRDFRGAWRYVSWFGGYVCRGAGCRAEVPRRWSGRRGCESGKFSRAWS